MRFVGVRHGSCRGMRPPTAVMCSFDKKESTLSLEPGYEFRVLQVSEGLQHVSLRGRKCLSDCLRVRGVGEGAFCPSNTRSYRCYCRAPKVSAAGRGHKGVEPVFSIGNTFVRPLFRDLSDVVEK